MPRRKPAQAAAPATAVEAQPIVTETTPDTKAEAPRYAPDPTPTIHVALSDANGGPSAHLLRSHRFNQMQIRFDGERPADEHLARLKQAGWKDRTQDEGVWTKQIDRDARWQSVEQMQQEFKSVANDIRKEKGLPPALKGMNVG